MKPLNQKSYGSIPYLQKNKHGDRVISEGQKKIATYSTRPEDVVFVTEKLDGSNVGVHRKNDTLIPITRSGYRCANSPWKQHKFFDQWVWSHFDRFMSVLKPGERICGEWLMMTHGVKYDLPHEPFVAFDIIEIPYKRLAYDDFLDRTKDTFVTPHLYFKEKGPVSISRAMKKMGQYGNHGAQEHAEGLVWRVENNGEYDFMAKVVHKDFIAGKYLDDDLWNVSPKELMESLGEEMSC